MSLPDAGTPPGDPGAPVAAARARTPEGWMALLAALVAGVPFIRTVAYPFVYDDGTIIVANTSLHSAHGLIAAWTLPYWPTAVSGPAGLYRPLVGFIYALLWNIGGGRASPFHIYAILLHVACAVALLFALSRALPAPAALIGALLFAADPVHVEAVASIVGSAEVLVTLLTLAFVGLAWRVDTETPDGESWRWPASAMLAVVYAAALATKESAAAVPAIALITLWGWRAAKGHAPSIRTLVRRGWRGWVACGIALVLLIVARHTVLGTLTPPASAIADGLAGVGVGTRLLTMIGAWPRVVALLFWPSHLMMHYGPSAIVPRTAPGATVLAWLAIAACVTAGSAWLAKRGDRRPLVALAWIALGYLPASNLLIPTGQLLAERTLYLPSVGAAMGVAWVIAMAPSWLGRLDAHRASTLVQAAGAVVCLIAVVVTFHGAAVWRAGDVLFRSGIVADPRAVHPRVQLARWYGHRGDEGRAMAEMDTAYRLAPTRDDLAFEYATHLLADHRAADALGVLRDASAANDTSARLRLTYLTTLLSVRGPRAVIDDIAHHTGRDAGGALRDVILAQSYTQLGVPDSAVLALRDVVRESPGDASARVLLARALARTARLAEAEAQLDTAAALGARDVPAERARVATGARAQ